MKHKKSIISLFLVLTVLIAFVFTSPIVKAYNDDFSIMHDSTVVYMNDWNSVINYMDTYATHGIYEIEINNENVEIVNSTLIINSNVTVILKNSSNILNSEITSIIMSKAPFVINGGSFVISENIDIYTDDTTVVESTQRGNLEVFGNLVVLNRSGNTSTITDYSTDEPLLNYPIDVKLKGDISGGIDFQNEYSLLTLYKNSQIDDYLNIPTQAQTIYEITINSGEKLNNQELSFLTYPGGTIKLPNENTFYYEHYHIKGWSHILDNNTVDYELNETINVSSPTNLYTVWEINSYTIDFEVNGGTIVSSLEQAYDSIIDLQYPELNGYTFEGWYTDNLKTQRYDLDRMPGYDMTLYANYILNNKDLTTDGAVLAETINLTPELIYSYEIFEDLSFDSILSIDVNDDDVLDYVAVTGSSVFVYQGNQNGDFNLLYTQTINNISNLYTFEKNSETLILSTNGSDVYMMTINQTGIQIIDTFINQGLEQSMIKDISVVDFNQDDKLDLLLLVSTQNNNTKGYLKVLNQGVGSVNSYDINLDDAIFDMSPMTYKLVIDDLNEDNLKELYYVSYNNELIQYDINSGNETVLEIMPENQLNVAVTDINRDGYKDIILFSYLNGVYVKTQNNNFTFEPSQLIIDSNILGINQIDLYQILDVNGDGYEDVLIHDQSSNITAWSENLRNSTYADFKLISNELQFFQLNINDYNRDGYDDILLTNGAAYLKISYGYSLELPEEDSLYEGYSISWELDDNGTMISVDNYISYTNNVDYIEATLNEINYNVNYHNILITDTNNNLDTFNVNDQFLNLNEPIRTGYVFQGWYISSDFSTDAVTQVELSNLADIDLYAKWDKSEFTINFDSLGGTPVDNLTAEYQTVISKPADPSRLGYSFDGWYLDSNYMTEYEFNLMGSQNIVLYAKWIINTYTINFDSNGGTSVNSITELYQNSIFEPEDPTKENYDFDGWFTDENFTLRYGFLEMGYENITLYAKWIPHEFTITFVTNNNQNIDQIVAGYQTIIEEPETPVKQGYDFNGWYLDQEFLQQYEFDTMENQNITLYASWSLKSYPIYFNTLGGSSIEAINVEFMDKVSEPEAPSKIGYTFNGWYVDLLLTQTYDFDLLVTEETILYASWQINQYSIKVWDGDYQFDTFEYNYNALITPLDDPVKEGFDFLNWSVILPERMPATNIDVEAQWQALGYKIVFKDQFNNILRNDFYYSGTDITEITYPETLDIIGYTFIVWNPIIPNTMPGKNIEIVAYYEANTYIIDFDNQGGSETQSIAAQFNEDIYIPNSPEREGYEFLGWIDYYSGTSYYQFTKMGSENITLHAVWEPKTYTVNFDSNGGTSVPSLDVKYDRSLNEPEEPTKDGYTFAGWYTDGSYEVKYIFERMESYDFTLYAKWEPKTYTISFDSNEGSPIDTISYEYGQEITQPEEPVKEGYVFGGWFIDQNLAELYEFDTMPSNDVELYAKWFIRIDSIIDDNREVNESEITLDNFTNIHTLEGDLNITGYLHPDSLESISKEEAYQILIEMKSVIVVYELTIDQNKSEKQQKLNLKDDVKPEITSIKDNMTYYIDEEISIDFNEGDAYLNGQSIENGQKVTKSGRYELVVTDESGNVTTVEFIVMPDIKTIAIVSVFPTLSLITLGTIIFKKKKKLWRV